MIAPHLEVPSPPVPAEIKQVCTLLGEAPANVTEVAYLCVLATNNQKTLLKAAGAADQLSADATKGE